MKKYITAIIRCYVCGNNRMTLHKIKTPGGDAYVCDRHNLPEFITKVEIDAPGKSRFTREAILKDIEIKKALAEKKQIAQKKVVAAEKLGIVK